MDPSSVTTSFQDIEAGWSCINFSQPPRLKKSRLHSLLQSLERWRQNHPMRRIERIQVVKDDGIIRGLNIMWSIFEHLQEQSKIAHFNIDEEVCDLYGHEYNEALVEDAIGFASENPTPGMNVVLVSRRKIAIVIIRQDGQAYVMTFGKFLATLESDVASDISTKFDEWGAQNDQGYFCTLLPEEYRP